MLRIPYLWFVINLIFRNYRIFLVATRADCYVSLFRKVTNDHIDAKFF